MDQRKAQILFAKDRDLSLKQERDRENIVER